jgi:DNA invertase Pin-like site-specific DNA recombinase
MARKGRYSLQLDECPEKVPLERKEKPILDRKPGKGFGTRFRDSVLGGTDITQDHVYVKRLQDLQNAHTLAEPGSDLRALHTEEPRMEYGLARVSTRDQNPALQLLALKQILCKHDRQDAPWLRDDFRDESNYVTGMFECTRCRCELHWERVSSKKTLAARLVTDAVIKKAQTGDRITCWKLDRLGRTTIEMLGLFEDFARRGIDFRCLSTPVDTTTAMGRAVLTVMIAFAQLERDINSERTAAGIALARTVNGKFWGRKPSATPDAVRKAERLFIEKNRSVTEVSAIMGVSRTTFYRTFIPKFSKPAHPIDDFVVELDTDEHGEDAVNGSDTYSD